MKMHNFFAFRFSEIKTGFFPEIQRGISLALCEAERCLGQRMWAREKSKEVKNLVGDRLLPQ